MDNYQAYLVCIKTLEQIYHFLEEVPNLFLGRVVGVAARLNGVDTGTVLAPLMLPELLVAAVVTDPVRLHIREQIGTVLRGQDVGNVGVCARRIAARLVGTVAVVGPSEFGQNNYSCHHR